MAHITVPQSGMFQSRFVSHPILFIVQWSAPEVLEYNKTSYQSDVWSLGVVFWEIFNYGRLPMADLSNKEAYVEIISGNKLSQPEGCPDAVYHLMMSCWLLNPDTRIIIHQLVVQLQAVRMIFFCHTSIDCITVFYNRKEKHFKILGRIYHNG